MVAVRRPLLRRLARQLGACWLVAGLGGCLAPPDAESLLAVGFRSPQQTFRTFKTAVRGDLPALEYRCFSAGFRRANGLSAHNYVEGRDKLLRENPFIRWVARAEIVSSEERGERGHYVEAVVDAKITKRRLGITFVRDDAVEVYGPRGELWFDDYVPFEDVVRVAQRGDGTWDLQARERFVPYEEHADPARVGEIRFLQDWKIDALVVLDGGETQDAASPSP